MFITSTKSGNDASQITYSGTYSVMNMLQKKSSIAVYLIYKTSYPVLLLLVLL